jgi:hypothetical protein
MALLAQMLEHVGGAVAEIGGGGGVLRPGGRALSPAGWRALDGHGVLLLAVTAALVVPRQGWAMQLLADQPEGSTDITAEPARVADAILRSAGAGVGCDTPYPRLEFGRSAEIPSTRGGKASTAACPACGATPSSSSSSSSLALTALPVFGSLVLHVHTHGSEGAGGAGGAGEVVARLTLRVAEFVMERGTVELAPGDVHAGEGTAVAGTPEHVVSRELGVVVAWRRLRARCLAQLQPRARQQLLGSGAGEVGGAGEAGEAACTSCTAAATILQLCQLHAMPASVLGRISGFVHGDGDQRLEVILARRLRV